MSVDADKSAQNTQPLDEKTLVAVADIPLFSETGEQVKFGSLYADKKTVVVFISRSLPIGFKCLTSSSYPTRTFLLRRWFYFISVFRLILIDCRSSARTIFASLPRYQRRRLKQLIPTSLSLVAESGNLLSSTGVGSQIDGHDVEDL